MNELSPSGEFLASSQGTGESRLPQRKLSRRTMLTILATVGVGSLVAGGGLLWETLRPHPLYTYTGHDQAVFAVAWSPDGKRIASGSRDTTVQVWDALDGSHPFTYRGHKAQVNAVAWSPKGTSASTGSTFRIASAGMDSPVQVWDAVDGDMFSHTGDILGW